MLEPGRKLLDRYSVSIKFSLIAVLFLIPIVLLGFLYGRSELANRTFNEKELQGVEALQPARLVLQPLLAHRGLAQLVLGGRSDQREALSAAATKVDAGFSEGDRVLATMPEYGLAIDWNALKQSWLQLKQDEAGMSSETSFARHNALVNQLASYFAHAADVTNLTLDPEVDSYYVMEAVSVRLPQLADLSGQVRGLGSGVAQRGRLSEGERTRLAVSLALFRRDFAALKTGMDKSSARNEHTRAALGEAMNEADQALGGLDNTVDQRFLRATLIQVDGQTFFADSSKAVDAVFHLYDAALPELQYLVGERVDQSRRTVDRVIVVVAVILALVAYFFLAFRAAIVAAVHQILTGAERMLQGDLSCEFGVRSNDELGKIGSGLDRMQAGLRARIDEERTLAASTERVKNALDGASANVMIADMDGVILYANRSVLAMFRAAEAKLRQDLPNLRVDTLIGSNFDIFHKEPARVRSLLRDLSEVHQSRVEIAGHVFLLSLSPIFDEHGERLGTVAEWLDRTLEVAVEREIETVVQAAADGDFSRRLEHAQWQGFFCVLGDHLNHLLDNNSRAFTDIGAAMSRIASGDLTSQIGADYRGELGTMKDHVNATVVNLQEMVVAIKQATEAINVASQEIASGNQDLSSRTEEQASSLEETASSMEELTSTVRQNAENARTANDLAGAAQAVAEQGGAVVGQVVETMGAIHQSSSKIADIIGVIDGIAFQTNILALNAAVEAARAGEQGRGFAVVATEVRNLAQRSAAAAKEIKGLISDSVSKVETGSRLVDTAGRTMEEVVGAIKRVAKLMTDIAEASREQAAGIDQVGLAVSQMDEVTQQNAALVEEAAAAAESLEEQARSLLGSVSVFRVSGTMGGVTPRLKKRAVLEHKQGAKKLASLPATLDDEWEEF
jgi:methyl-accepting chemotaxis protein